jgi:UDP-2,3-diacylglucosamine pyrophosphatase LpxH
MTSTHHDDRPPVPNLVTLHELPQRVLVLSDLHLGYGRDAATGRYDRTENFFADDAFRRLLEYHDPDQAGPTLLVLNGDIFDFLRIATCPQTEQELTDWSAALETLGVTRTPEELKSSIVSKERRFGLRTHDFKSVWKFLEIARGHPGFLDGLGWWVSRGGSVAFVKGNHDVELHWQLVQRSIRRRIASGYPGSDVDQRVLFVPNRLQVGNVYFEHGHEYESVTRVIGDATRSNGEELNLPLGSFVNRYIINKLERLEPFLDNVKPVQTLLWTLVRRHPLKLLEIIWRSFPFIRRAARPYWLRESFGFALYFLSLLVPVLTIAIVAAVLLLPGFGSMVRDLLGWLRVPLGIAGVVAPYLVAAVRDLLPKKRYPNAEDRHGQAAYDVLQGVRSGAPAPVLYGVMGHTHLPDVQRLPGGNGQILLYINDGSWAPTWREARPDLTGRTIYSFVRFDRVADHYEHACLEWRDDRRAPADAMIMNEHTP